MPASSHSGRETSCAGAATGGLAPAAQIKSAAGLRPDLTVYRETCALLKGLDGDIGCRPNQPVPVKEYPAVFNASWTWRTTSPVAPMSKGFDATRASMLIIVSM